MSAPLGLTTELEAINEMLEAAGEAPVDSLVSGRADIAVARAILNREIRRLCAEGWYWNTDKNFILSPDGDGKFPLPTNALNVDPHDTSKQITVRGRFLWDLKNFTAVFTDAEMKVDIRRALPFSDLQQDARDWVTMISARKFVKRVGGDETMVSFTDEDVGTARLRLEKAEDDNADHSLRNSAGMGHIFGRYRNTYGGPLSG